MLRGYKATSHWAARDLLVAGGAEPVDARVVIDRNRVTGAGVSAGLDFGLKLVAMMRDEAYAKSVQLLAEYAPEPPF
ncbi:DJ-1/PfpI family protein, partial [Stenotrophomonas maltophilia]|uniref:DJ-1/PfpI family protein n=1 Tax=Stenotrophomonas maltophilia TaxID=40324 RepID=UPI001953EC9D